MKFNRIFLKEMKFLNLKTDLLKKYVKNGIQIEYLLNCSLICIKNIIKWIIIIL